MFVNDANLGGRGVFTCFYGSVLGNSVTGNEAGAGGVSSIWARAVAHKAEPAPLAFSTFANNRLAVGLPLDRNRRRPRFAFNHPIAPGRLVARPTEQVPIA